MFDDFGLVGVVDGLAEVVAHQLGLGLGHGLLVVDVELRLALPVVLKQVVESVSFRQEPVLRSSRHFRSESVPDYLRRWIRGHNFRCSEDVVAAQLGGVGVEVVAVGSKEEVGVAVAVAVDGLSVEDGLQGLVIPGRNDDWSDRR